MIQCLDPSTPGLREATIQHVTAALQTLVKRFPIVSFHKVLPLRYLPPPPLPRPSLALAGNAAIGNGGLELFDYRLQSAERAALPRPRGPQVAPARSRLLPGRNGPFPIYDAPNS